MLFQRDDLSNGFHFGYDVLVVRRKIIDGTDDLESLLDATPLR